MFYQQVLTVSYSIEINRNHHGIVQSLSFVNLSSCKHYYQALYTDFTLWPPANMPTKKSLIMLSCLNEVVQCLLTHYTMQFVNKTIILWCIELKIHILPNMLSCHMFYFIKILFQRAEHCGIVCSDSVFYIKFSYSAYH